MKDTISGKDLINKAKEYIDEGFSKMNREVKDPRLLGRYVLAATYKAIRLSDAIILLCKNGKVEEAIPTLRSLMEHVINMCWITNKGSETRLQKYMSVLGNYKFGSIWTNEKLDMRMRELGFDDDYYDFCMKVTYDYSHVNATALRWGEVFEHPQLSKKGWSPEALYMVTAQMLGHVIKTLDKTFPGYFDGYRNIWSKIRVEKKMRKKVEELKETIEKQLHTS